jgi:tryptophan-rich sensory protein
VTTVVICAVASVLEGVSAGTRVRSFFASQRFPRPSPPLWLWSAIGALYYAVFGFVLYRLLGLDAGSLLRSGTISLTVLMLLMNGLTNYVIFRRRDFRSAFLVGATFPIFDLTLFLLLLRLDRTAALVLCPYLAYRAYAVWWGYGLWKLNR